MLALSSLVSLSFRPRISDIQFSTSRCLPSVHCWKSHATNIYIYIFTNCIRLYNLMYLRYTTLNMYTHKLISISFIDISKQFHSIRLTAKQIEIQCDTTHCSLRNNRMWIIIIITIAFGIHIWLFLRFIIVIVNVGYWIGLHLNVLVPCLSLCPLHTRNQLNLVHYTI